MNKGKWQQGFLWLGLCLLLGGLVACDKDKHSRELRQYVEKVQDRKSGKIKPLPTFDKAYQPHRYTGHDLRSPFNPPIQMVEATGGDTPDQNREKEELEAYPLDALRMIGTISQGNKTWALLQTPDGMAHQVTVGNYVGQDYGRIVSISSQKMAIEGRVRVSGEGWVKQSASLSLVE